MRIGALSIASRSSMASLTVATPSHSAPELSAVRATWTAPWPYASALTTAIKRVRELRRRRYSPTLWRMAAKSISTHDQRRSMAGMVRSLSGSK